MGSRVGIPRSLFYYKFKPLWETFFTCLGAEVVVSEPTNKRILDDGVKACVDEACLPVKLFHGHVINLRDRVDYILVPRFTSISRNEYICPEFGGLPDMVRHTLKGLPPLIDMEINMRKSGRRAIEAAVEAAAILGVGKHAAESALRAAMEAYHDSQNRMLCGVLPFGDSGRSVPTDQTKADSGRSGEHRRTVPLCLTVAVIGHPYNIYDPYINMDLLGKLRRFGVNTITTEMVTDGDINHQASQLNKPMFWNYGRHAYGAAIYLAENGAVDGFLCVTSFGCGIDSVVHDLIERKIRRENNIPFITVTIDEHTGEAGFNTRVEAFVDMLQWRKTHENNISASG